MESRKDLTKHLIASSFKELMQQHPFEKISIMMIVDKADIRRPSFYNHFQDKYDLLEWIVSEDLIRQTRMVLEKGMPEEAFKMLFTSLLSEADFYRRAFTVTGQNGFEEAFTRQIQVLFTEFLQREETQPPRPGYLTVQDVAHFNAVCFTAVIRDWLENNRRGDAEQLLEAYRYLSEHPVESFLNRKK